MPSIGLQARRVLEQARMPAAQTPHHAFLGNLFYSLMDPGSSIRLAKTTASNRKAIGSLSTPQRFTRPPAGPNTPETLEEGRHKVNTPRVRPRSRPGRM